MLRRCAPVLLLLLLAPFAFGWQSPHSAFTHATVKPLAALRPITKQPAQNFGFGSGNDLSLAASRRTADPPALFSLDKPVYPRRHYLLEGLLAATLAPAAVSIAQTAVSKTLAVTLPLLRAIAGVLTYLLEQASKTAERREENVAVVTNAAQNTGSAVAIAAQRLVQRMSSWFPRIEASELLDLEQWQPCKLVSREKLSNDYAIYRFELGNARAALPLNPGQELILCARDTQDALVKEPFFPISPRKANGYFEVLVKKTHGTTGMTALASIAVGDEVAVKAGKDRLSAKAPGEQIESMQIVASAEGIAPAIQTLQAVLQPKDSTVKSVDLIWVNEHQHEFTLAKQVEAISRRYPKKIRVIPLIDNDLYGHDITNNPIMRQTLRPFEPSTMAILCGPDYVVERVQRYLSDTQGYPYDHIAPIKF